MLDENKKIFVDNTEIEENNPKYKELYDLTVLADNLLTEYQVPEKVELLFDAYECKDGMLYAATLVDGKFEFKATALEFKEAITKAILLWRSDQ